MAQEQQSKKEQTKKFVFVNNLQPRIFRLDAPTIKVEKSVVHKNEALKVFWFAGVNKATSDQWNYFKNENPFTKKHFDNFQIELCSAYAQEFEKFSDVPMQSALKVIPLIFSKDLIDEWLKNESRPEIHLALKGQLEKILK